MHPQGGGSRRDPRRDSFRVAPGSQAHGNVNSIDWAGIEQKLHNIPEDFKSNKFNSLKRVIEILSKDKPQWALSEVQSSFTTCP
jgi:hypothetical protein